MKIVTRRLVSLIIAVVFALGVPAADLGIFENIGGSDNTAYAAETEHRYARTMLENKSQRYIYDKYLEAIKAGKSYCKFDTKKYKMSEKNFRIASYAIWFDYPEYGYWLYHDQEYWWSGTEKNKTITKVEIFYDKTLKNKLKELNARIKAIVKSIPEECVSDYDKALYLHDFICDNTVYCDEATEDNPWPAKQQTAYGPIVYGKAVCEGYSRAYQALLHEAGIQSLPVYGYLLMGEDASFDQFNSYVKYGGKNWSGHGWNVAWLDGECYYIDATLEDPTDPDAECFHNYFAKSREEYDETHLVRVGGKIDKVLDSFQKKLLGECGHESLEYEPDNCITLTDPLNNEDLEALVNSFGETYYSEVEDKNCFGYTREVYLKYDGEFDTLNDWRHDNGYKIFNAIGLNGNFIEHYIYWWDSAPGFYLYQLTGTSTVNEMVEEPLDTPIVASIKNSSKKQIQLKWYDVDEADKYEIYRKTSKNGTYKKVRTTSKLSFTDKELKKGKTYYYKVKAIDTDNPELNSEYSIVTSAKI